LTFHERGLVRTSRRRPSSLTTQKPPHGEAVEDFLRRDDVLAALADALSLPGATFSAPPTESKPSQSTVGGSRTATAAPRMTD
jgi:hypothetical protein